MAGRTESGTERRKRPTFGFGEASRGVFYSSSYTAVMQYQKEKHTLFSSVHFYTSANNLASIPKFYCTVSFKFRTQMHIFQIFIVYSIWAICIMAYTYAVNR